MASYDVPSSVVIAALASSTISPETTREIIKVLNENTSGTVQINAYPDGVVTGNDLNGANIAVVAGGKVYLIRASNADMAALDLILFTGDHQGKRVLEAFDELFSTWKPREKYELINTNEVKDRVINHKLLY